MDLIRETRDKDQLRAHPNEYLGSIEGREISLEGEKLLASQKGLLSMELL
jgi:hypothetical protein